MSEDNVRIVPVQVGSATLRVEARDLGGPEKVGILDSLAFTEVTAALEAIGAALARSIATIRPQRATVELGVEVGLEAGQLVALLTKASGKGNLKVTLEWKADTPARPA